MVNHYKVIKMKDINRILLINPPNETTGHNTNYACFPHMGIVSLGTQVLKKYPHIDIRTADGGIKSTDQITSIIDSYRPDVLGISVLTPTYAEGLRIAEYAKRRYGSTIILGDDHASFFPKVIMENRAFVDYIITNDVGEIPFILLIDALKSGADPSKVPSLVYRSKTEVIQTGEKTYSLGEVYAGYTDIPNLKLLGAEIKDYAKNYNEKFGRFHSDEVKPITVNNARGCGNGKLRCTYCSINDLSINPGKPEQFWRTIEKYRDEGLNFFFEVCDSFGSFGAYINGLLKTMPFNPKEEGIELMVYARAQDIATKPALLDQFKKLNITRVNMGLDSGDAQTLISQRKGNKRGHEVEVNTCAVTLLSKSGITIHASFIAGACGETMETLGNTIDYMRLLMKEQSFSSLEFSRHIPLPNSPSWDILIGEENSFFYKHCGGIEKVLGSYDIALPPQVKTELREKYAHTDILNIDELGKDWITHFTHLKHHEVSKTIEEMNKEIEANNINTGNNVG